MPKIAALAVVCVVCLLVGKPALAEIIVSIEEVTPSDGNLSDGDVAVINWEIEATDGESGEYRVEVEGDGSPDSGDLVEDSSGQGDFSGDISGSTTVSADDDLDEGDGDYVIYVIAVDDADSENYDFASTTLSLDNPPDAPEGLSVDIGDQKLFLSWDSHPDNDIKKYYIYYDTDSGLEAGDYDGSGADDGSSPIEIGDQDDYTMKGLENGVTYYIRIGVKDDTGNVSPLSAEKNGTPQTVSGLAELTGEEGGCFVATAAYGSYDAPEVRVLRRFRDEILLSSAAGRAFVRLYYTHGPRAAAFVSGHPLLTSAARTALAPAVIGAKCILAVPAGARAPAVFAMALLCGVCVALFLRTIRRRTDGFSNGAN